MLAEPIPESVNIVQTNEITSENNNVISIEEQLKCLQEENVKLREQINNLTQCKEKITIEKASLNEQLKLIDKKVNKIEFDKKINDVLSTIFSPGQIKKLLNPKKRINWSCEDIACAISLRSVSTKAYRYLRSKLKYPLPALSTLRKWATNLNCYPGIMKQVLLIMQNNGTFLNEFEKLTALSFDEMSLNKKICFDRHNERLFGPHSDAQVLIARGITGKWKQPIYYDFDKAMTKETLYNVIIALEEVGYKVVSVTSDMGGKNKTLWNSLCINPDKTHFINPYDSSRKVFVFYDVPHLLKLARNHFVEKGFITEDGTHLTSNTLKEIINLQSTDLKLAFRLRTDHIFIKNKQNVKLAAQLFSNTTSKAIHYLGEQGLLTGNWQKTSEMIGLFNDWFDIFNSKVAYDKIKEKCGFGLHIEQQISILDRMSTFIKSMLVFGKKSCLPFQNGVLISNQSLRELFAYLNLEYQISYITTAKLNQDVLENFFSYIRSMGKTYDHPDAIQFMYRMRWYLLGKYTSTAFILKSNIEPDDEHCLSVSKERRNSEVECEEICPTANLLNKLVENSDTIEECDDTIFEHTPTHENSGYDVIKEEGLQYLTGYVALKLCNKYPQLGIITSKKESTSPTSTWIELVSKGGLRIPSEDFLKCAKFVEEGFLKIHGNNGICKDSGIIQKVFSVVENEIHHLNIPKDAVQRLILVRTFIRLKHLNDNKWVIEEQNLKKKKKKVSKFKY